MAKTKTKTYLESGRVLFLPPELIRPNPDQPRRIFDQQALQELADSIVQHGLIQPISVRRQGGAYELVAGERRLRAARMAGLEEVPCVLMAVDGAQSGLLALVENLQRRDLDYLEQAEGIARLMQLYGLNQEQAARRLGKSPSAVANKLRLLKHSPAVRAALRQSGLSERHARALLKLPGEEERMKAIREMACREMTAARAEAYVDQLLARAHQPRQGMRKFLVRDVRLFLNSVNHHLETMKNAGIQTACSREDTEEEIVLTIRLPRRIGPGARNPAGGGMLPQRDSCDASR